ncbi:hypothetical protein Tco_0917676, partial [Tanacetum coccineum]
VESTAKTRKPQPKSNTKNDRVSSASKSSRINNKEVENDKSIVFCAICKQCLITANHDVYVLNYVNDMNSHANNQNVNVSNIENQKKHKAKVKKLKKLGSKERHTSPRPRKPRTCLRWPPTRRTFDLSGKLIQSSDFECQSDIFEGENACASNHQEPTSKQFPNSTSFLARLSKFVYGTIRFGNDHVAVVLGYRVLQWRNILIARVYFIEGLGHNLSLVGQFYDSDLEGKSKKANPNPFQLKAEATPASYGFVWANESRKCKWEAICSDDSG